MSGNPAHISRRAQKKAASEAATYARRSKFTKIVDEQGGLCFYCGENMAGDCTREHLLARVLGGDNSRANLRAAHGDCNSAAGHFPISDKLRMREIGLTEGREAMLLFARQLRRADARLAFAQGVSYRPNDTPLSQAPLGRAAPEVVSGEVMVRQKPVRGPTGLVLDKGLPTVMFLGKKWKGEYDGDGNMVFTIRGRRYAVKRDISAPDPKTYSSS